MDFFLPNYYRNTYFMHVLFCVHDEVIFLFCSGSYTDAFTLLVGLVVSLSGSSRG